MNLLKMRFENSLFYELPVTNPEAKVDTFFAVAIREYSENTMWLVSKDLCIFVFL